MAKSPAEKQADYRRRKRERIAAIKGKADAALLPVVSISDVRDFCEELGTLPDWDDGDPGAIAKAHQLAMKLAMEIIRRQRQR
jgi:hypothetical protein